MKSRSILLLGALLLLLVPGCLLIDGTDNNNDVSVRFRTTQDLYEPIIVTEIAVFMNFEIATRLENTGDVDIVLIGCINPSMPMLQKSVDEEWVFVYAVAEPLCISPPWFLKPGKVYRDTLRVSTILDPNVVPEAKWENGIPVDGMYRLKRMIYGSGFEGDLPQGPLPLPQRVSQTFEVRAVHALIKTAESLDR